MCVIRIDWSTGQGHSRLPRRDANPMRVPWPLESYSENQEITKKVVMMVATMTTLGRRRPRRRRRRTPVTTRAVAVGLKPTCAPTLFFYFPCSWMCLSAPCSPSIMPGSEMLRDAGPRAVQLFLGQVGRCLFLPRPRALRACRLLHQSSGHLGRSGDLLWK